MLRSSLLSLAPILRAGAIASVVSISLAGQVPVQQKSQTNEPVDQLIPWLLDEGRQLRGIPFAEVILDATGKRVLPVNTKDEIDQRVIRQISAACDETIKRFNTPDSAIQNVVRINEVSSHFEDSLRQLLNTAPGLNCDFPRTAEGRVQRSGYPDRRRRSCEQARLLSRSEALRYRESGEQFSSVLFRTKSGHQQGARRRRAFGHRIRTSAAGEKWRMEVHALGPR
jgi:hypothetical protein